MICPSSLNSDDCRPACAARVRSITYDHRMIMNGIPSRIRQAVIVLSLVGLVPAGASGQQASTTAEYQPAQILALRPPTLPAALASPVAFGDRTPSPPSTLTTGDSTHASWWVRHPTTTGALAGMIVGLGVYYLQAGRDPYCRDPDFFPCELYIPVYVGAGAVTGGLLGYIAGRIFR
jgi:hypothetical protein